MNNVRRTAQIEWVPDLDVGALQRGRESAVLELGPKRVRLTQLSRPVWPEVGLRKVDLLEYYARISHVLLPHLRDRAIVLKRYPAAAHGDFFFMKRAPPSRPDWVQICSIEHRSGRVIDLVLVQDLADLLWVVNLGCIELNQWYARCDGTDRPDALHLELEPVQGEPAVPQRRVCEVAQIVRAALAELGMPCHAKTSGSGGLHLCVPIRRGPTQRQVWNFARELARSLAELDPDRMTAEYRCARRPAGRVLLDYNQNAWGRTLASVYSVRALPGAPVSTPITWAEVEAAVAGEQFQLRNLPERIARLGDLWAPVGSARGRVDLVRALGRSARLRAPS